MNNELYHHGVKGMKWGERRTLKKESKRRESDAFKEYQNTIRKIEKPYKPLQKLSQKDYGRELDAKAKYYKTVMNARTDYRKALGPGSRATKAALLIMGGVALTSLSIYSKVGHELDHISINNL